MTESQLSSQPKKFLGRSILYSHTERKFQKIRCKHVAVISFALQDLDDSFLEVGFENSKPILLTKAFLSYLSRSRSLQKSFKLLQRLKLSYISPKKLIPGIRYIRNLRKLSICAFMSPSSDYFQVKNSYRTLTGYYLSKTLRSFHIHGSLPEGIFYTILHNLQRIMNLKEIYLPKFLNKEDIDTQQRFKLRLSKMEAFNLSKDYPKWLLQSFEGCSNVKALEIYEHASNYILPDSEIFTSYLAYLDHNSRSLQVLSIHITNFQQEKSFNSILSDLKSLRHLRIYQNKGTLSYIDSLESLKLEALKIELSAQASLAKDKATVLSAILTKSKTINDISLGFLSPQSLKYGSLDSLVIGLSSLQNMKRLAFHASYGDEMKTFFNGLRFKIDLQSISLTLPYAKVVEVEALAQFLSYQRYLQELSIEYERRGHAQAKLTPLFQAISKLLLLKRLRLVFEDLSYEVYKGLLNMLESLIYLEEVSLKEFEGFIVREKSLLLKSLVDHAYLKSLDFNATFKSDPDFIDFLLLLKKFKKLDYLRIHPMRIVITEKIMSPDKLFELAERPSPSQNFERVLEYVGKCRDYHI